MMKLQLARYIHKKHKKPTISPQIRRTQIPPTAKKNEHLSSTKCLGRLFAISRYIHADVQRDLHSERPYVYQRTLRNPLDDNSSCEWIAFTTRSRCHGDDRCVSFHLCAHTGCGHYASYDSEEPNGADRRDTPAHHPQTSPPSHPQHGPTRRTAGGGDKTRKRQPDKQRPCFTTVVLSCYSCFTYMTCEIKFILNISQAPVVDQF